MQPTNSSLTEIENFSDPKKAAFTPAFLLSDLILRFLVHWLFLLNIIGPLLFWIVQLLLIPITTLVLLYSASGRESQWKEYIKKKENNSDDFKVEIENSPMSVLFGFLNFVLGLYISWQLYSSYFSFWLVLLLLIITFITYGFYVMFIYTLSYGKIPKEGQASDYDKEKNEVDRNDIRLINLEVAVNGFSQRIDTYTIESALLGALAFSCFLTILGVDPQLPSDAKLLTFEIKELFTMLLKFNIAGIQNLFEGFKFYTVANILSVLAFEALVCALLYLMVIVKRIHFYNNLDNVQKNLQVAKSYNQKEEEYDLLCIQNIDNEDFKNRKIELTEKVKTYSDRSAQNLEKLKMVMKYMTFVRETALFIFVLIIATSACIVSFYTGMVFILLYLLFLLMHNRLFLNLLAKLEFLKFNKTVSK
jgi:uncharacterized membrane protein